MEAVDETVLATSLPIIAVSFGENPIALKLALTSYFVSLAVFIPISGWIADRFGTQNVFRAAIIIFMLGSMLCGIAHSLAFFTAARFLQGIGGAMMIPVGRLIIFRSVPKTELIRAWSYLIMPVMVGPIIGPPLGGLITTTLGWRFIFFINIPISLITLACATRYIKDIEKPPQLPCFDFLGFSLLAPGLSCLMFGLATAGQYVASLPISCTVLGVGALLIGMYVVHAKRTPHPVLNFSLFHLETFRIGIVSASLFRMGIGALPLLLPLLLQLGCEMDPFHAGLAMCAAAIGALCMNSLVHTILQRFGFRTVLMVNTILVALSTAAIASFTTHTSYAVMALILLAGGCFRSLHQASLNSISYADIHSTQASAATSLESVARKLSIGIGVTIGAFALEAPHHVLHAHEKIGIQDFSLAFITISLISLSSLFYLMKLPKGAGDAIASR